MSKQKTSGTRLPDTPEQATFDVRRSVILGHYIRAWGMPRDRVRATHGETGHVLEVYAFPAHEDMPVWRFATVGVSGRADASGEPDALGKELMIALPADLGGASEDELFDFMLDMAAYAVYTREDIEPPFTVAPTPLAPPAWTPRAMLVDQARGEPEELGEMALGDTEVELLWVIPIHASEYAFIGRQGIEAFDERAEAAELSLVDIARPPFV